MITSRALHSMLLIAALGIWSAEQVPAFAEGGASAALAAAMKDATATLQGGLKASEREGTPISAKFRDRGRKAATFGVCDEGRRLHGGRR